MTSWRRRAESAACSTCPETESFVPPDPSSTPARVIVAGGGVAAVETLLALRRPRRRASRDDDRRAPAHVHLQRHGGRPGVFAGALASRRARRSRGRGRPGQRGRDRSRLLIASGAPAGLSWAMTTSCSPSAQERAQLGGTASRSARIPRRRLCTGCSRRSSEATWGRSRSSSPGAAQCGRSRSTNWPSWRPARPGAWAWIGCGSRWSPRRSDRSQCSVTLRARPSGSCSTAAASSSSARPMRRSATASCSSTPPGGGWTACAS